MSSLSARDDVSHDAESARASLPRAIGRYDLLHEIATGGMATVYLGRARGAAGFGRFVAIKCCHPHLRAQEEFATMFVDEARLAAKIHHPNVIATLDVSEDSAATLYLVMEYVDGYSLAQVVKAARARGARLPPAIAARLVADALAGLHAAHELRDDDGRLRGIVHRDVSPHNVLVGVDGAARIMDFGIAKAESRLTVTREGHIKGKLAYMAPEQHGLGLPDTAALPTVDRRADLYAAGVVLWEALTGERLFQGDSDSETVRLVVRGVPRRPSEVAGPSSGIPAALDAVVMRALERDPARRFATAEQFVEALEGCGLALPSARAVSAFLHELLAPAIAARRQLLTQFRETTSDRPEPSRVGARPSTAALAASSEGSVGGIAIATGREVDRTDSRALADALGPAATRRAVQLVAIAAVLLAGLLVAFAALRPARPVDRPTRAAAPPPPIASRATAPAPPVVTAPPAPDPPGPALTAPATVTAPRAAPAREPARARRAPARSAPPAPGTGPQHGRYRPHFL